MLSDLDADPGRSLAWWSAAATLAERAQAKSERIVAQDVDRQLIHFRLDTWTSQPPFHDGQWFARRLAQIGVDESEVPSLLGPQQLMDGDGGQLPRWAARIQDLYGSVINAPETSGNAWPGSQKTDHAGFLALTHRLTRDAQAQVQVAIRAAFERLPLLDADLDSVVTCLSNALEARLLPMLGRTCALELNALSIEGRLAGTTAAERYQSFVTLLADSAHALELLKTYPVLSRQVVTAIDHWTAGTLEWVRHLVDDWPQILDHFGRECAPDELIAVESTEGDLHAGGRAPLILLFRSGFKIVYKPRSLAMETHFQGVVDWVNELGQSPPLRRANVFDRGTYGWMEFIPHRPCNSHAEVGDFYQRQGSLLAILYALGSSDFHRENVIADMSDPVPIDLETLFFPKLRREEDVQGGRRARRALADSVLRVGLLPQRIWGSDEWNGIDLSGLSGDADQRTPFGVPQWEGVGTDKMRVVRKQAHLGPSTNRPFLQENKIEAADYAAAIVAGFEKTYRIVLEHRHSLLLPGGPLARFQHDELRVVLRPTRTYSVLLHESYHPDFMRDAVDRDRLFDLLWATVPNAEYLEPLVQLEQESLHAGDVPRFTTGADSLDLRGSAGERVDQFFLRSGLEEARDRVIGLCEADLRRQAWLIRASLATTATEGMQGWSRKPPEPSIARADQGSVRTRALSLADSIGQRLDELAYEGPADAAWIGLVMAEGNRWSLSPLRMNLYDGLPGVAIFLAYLGAIQGNERYTTLAKKAIELSHSAHAAPLARAPVGSFSGAGGLIYAYTHLAPLLEAPELLVQAEKLAVALEPLAIRDIEHDIIGGNAGCIASLLSLYRCRQTDAILWAAISCGKRLVDTATHYADTVGWNKPAMADRALAGFAHGVAGEAWALLRLAELTGDESFKRTGWAAIAYERTLFSESHQNWPDMRAINNREPCEDRYAYTSSWCHGAPGIGLARLDLRHHFFEPGLDEEIEVACSTTLRTGFGLNHSLCHGDLGNVELLTRASQTSGFEHIGGDADLITEAIVSDIELNGPRCGIPLQAESPGLMTGLAGIGLGLLRIAKPEVVPSVLLLEPPTFQ